MLSLTDFLAFAKSYSVIPISKVVGQYQNFRLNILKISNEFPDVMLLESGEHGKEAGRYTYFAINPFLVLQVNDHQVTLSGASTELEQLKKLPAFSDLPCKPIPALKAILKHYNSPYLKELPPFTGGGLGFFSYEFIKEQEHISTAHQLSSQFAELYLAFVKEVLIYDHSSQELILVNNLFIHNLPENELVKSYEQAQVEITKRVTFWQNFLLNHQQGELLNDAVPEKTPGKLIKAFDRETFVKAVEKIKRYIREGEIFQAVLSQKITVNLPEEKALIYEALRQINPSPYMYYLQFDDQVILGTSPETLVNVVAGKATTYPIAGTRRRGRNEVEEQKNELSLLSDTKELAEHVMLIDLARNDLGRISKPGTVKVLEKMKIEKYSHVMHLVSKVVGELKKDVTSLDALIAAFPAGTVSGAPKIRAMQIIAELELEERGPYAGAIAALGFNGNLDTCITIRSIFCKGNTATIQAGAGIVADSEPDKEYLEITNKASAMLRALSISEELAGRELSGEKER